MSCRINTFHSHLGMFQALVDLSVFQGQPVFNSGVKEGPLVLYGEVRNMVMVGQISPISRLLSVCLWICVNMCMYVYTCVCIYVCLCVYIHVSVYTCVCIYVYVCVHTYVYICVYVSAHVYVCVCSICVCPYVDYLSLRILATDSCWGDSSTPVRCVNLETFLLTSIH